MDKLKQNYRNALENALRAQDPSTADAIEKVINNLQSTNEKMISKKEATLSAEKIEKIRSVFDQAANEFRNEHNKKSASFKEVFEKSVKGFETKISLLKGVIIGVAATVATVILLNEVSLIYISFKNDIKAQTELYNNYTKERNLARLANEYLIKVTDEIKNLQATKPDELTKIAGKNFVSLNKIDEALFKARPKQLAGSENIIVRADKKAYKVLMNSNLCSVIAIDQPKLVDPKRKNKKRTCMHFGYWNEAGQKL
ncbi:hypothetical protein [Paenochrobactrum pullorum]|uniref:hypothetical protein n=1 Tax=Paenochrobactrum pullorum TaxID=1324351 RepID=UPI0035BBFB87